MKILTTATDLRAARANLTGSVAFVPTMGFLHEGHLSLMRTALEHCDHLVVSIFVNPTQFGPGEDLENYPRDLEGDIRLLTEVGCDLLFTPQVSELYAPDHSTRVIVDELDQTLCGPRRPGHFHGVTTIVAKLFNIVTPDVAVFGQKDYQQLATIRRMVRDLDFPIEILGSPTVREPDGLAMSSRNRYLSSEEREQAAHISQALIAAHKAYQAGERDAAQLIARAQTIIEEIKGARIDYIECVHPDTLATLDIAGDDGALLAIALFLGSARLIDNLRLDDPLPASLSRNQP